MRANSRKCPQCTRRLIKAKMEGYDITKEEKNVFILGRLCKFCKVVFINPDFSNYTTKVSVVGT